MDNDIIFKKAKFGGFNRNDVTAYIVTQKEKSVELENRINFLTDENKDLTDKVNEFENSVFAKENEITELNNNISVLNDKITELENKLSENDIDRLNKSITDKDFEIAAKNKTIEELKNTVSELTAQNEKIKTELARNSEKELELKIGNAMIDVRKFADMVIGDAENKINEMEIKAHNATDATQARLNDITLGLNVFKDKLNSVISDVLSDAETLNGDMDAFTKYFEEPKKALNEYSYNTNGDK